MLDDPKLKYFLLVSTSCLDTDVDGTTFYGILSAQTSWGVLMLQIETWLVDIFISKAMFFRDFVADFEPFNLKAFLSWELFWLGKDGCCLAVSAFNLAQLLAGNPRCVFFQWPLLVICRHWILCSQPQHLWKSIDSHDMHLGLEKERFGFKQFLGWYWFMLTGLSDGLVHGWGWGWWCRWWWGGGGWMWMRRRTVIMIL